jgi:uncharacterized protein (DUF58 family)
LVSDELSDRCGMVAFAGSVITNIRPIRRGSRLVLRQALQLTPIDTDADYTRAMTVTELARPTVVMMCTDIVDPSSVEPLATALQGVASRRRVVIVSPDDVLDAGGHSPMTTEVLGQMARDRAAAISMIRSTGAAVVTGPPEHIAERAVRAYLNNRFG